MFDLTKPWPPGLNRETWVLFVLSFAVGVLLIAQLDVWSSLSAMAWSHTWRAPFFFITVYGLSNWVLIPSLSVFVLSVFAGHFLRGVPRLASYEMSTLAGYIFVGVGLPGLACNLIKRLIGRGRPDVLDQAGAFSFHNVINGWTYQSFPSGHSTTAIALAFTIGFIVPRLFYWLLAIGLVVSFSRVPVGMHYPSDVFAGVCLGVIGAYCVRNAFAKRRWMFRTRPDGCIVPRSLSAIRRLYQRARA